MNRLSAGITVNKKRAALDPNQVDSLVFLANNIKVGLAGLSVLYFTLFVTFLVQSYWNPLLL